MRLSRKHKHVLADSTVYKVYQICNMLAFHKQNRRLFVLTGIMFVLSLFLFCPDFWFFPWSSEDDGTPSLNLTLNLSGATFYSRVLPWKSSPRIPRLLSVEDHDRSIELLRVVDTILRQNNITCVLAYGNLIGSYVMHDLLPWDDDIDILVRLADQSKMEEIFRNKALPIESMPFYNGMTQTVKLYFKDSPHAGWRSWRWPFIDVAFYGENATHVWNTDYYPMVLQRASFYPLHQRPLASLWMPAPRDTGLFLKVHYGHLTCSTHAWNHRWEVPTWRVYSAPCSSLIKSYPFVKREKFGDKVKETLQFNSRSLYSVVLEESFSSDNQFNFEN